MRICIWATLSYAVLVVVAQTAWTEPLTPLEVQKLIADDGAAFDSFGVSVSVDGNTAAIGASGESDDGFLSGSVYLFKRVGTSWIQHSKLTASDGASGHRFGSSIALDGNTLLIGAIGDDRINGSAYIFRRSGGAWTERAKLTPSGSAPGDGFGRGVELHCNTALIGSTGIDSAYIFTRSSGAWTEQARLIAGAPGVNFGSSVALDCNTAIIGAPGDDAAGRDSGAAYVFIRSENTWSEPEKLVASDGAELDAFGISVALDNDTLVVGAGGDDDNGESSGSAYLFTRNAGAWIEEAKLTASDGAAFDGFGRPVAIDGNTILIGAASDDNITGSVYVYTRNGGVWTERANFTGSDAVPPDGFGSSVAIHSDTALVGMPGDDGEDDDAFATGSAFVFDLGTVLDVEIDIRPFGSKNRIKPRSRDTVPVAILGSEQFDALQADASTVRFGPESASAIRTATKARDVNHDGFTDLVVRFKIRRTGIQCGDGEATLSAETFSGQAFHGTDSISTTGCKKPH